ncbi:hypothetical protein NSQ14_01220 [Caldifermentibacillus hisashii]|uniref:hypothetical protein n=1 Tax=Caldifermentibacillus hisashii TaxID=996558 RepID=UPI0031FE1FF4
MTTNPILVAILGRETLNFDDETYSRHHFEGETPNIDDEPHSRRHFGARNTQFWRRESLSSPILGGKRPFMTTRPVLVAILM